MRNPPERIAVPDSAHEVTEHIKMLLKAAGVGHQLPTPKSQILDCAQLVEAGELNLEEYKQTLSDKAHVFFRAISKILGLLDFNQHIVYVNPGVPASRKNFVTYHEVSHRVLPWQRQTYAEDDEFTLDPRCVAKFEAEANFGAAEILFQCERFQKEIHDFPLHLDVALRFAEKYDASYHATLRRYAERNHRPCLLLVLKRTSRVFENGHHSYFVIYTIPSLPFTRRFGDPFDGVAFLEPDNRIAQIIDTEGQGEVNLNDTNGFFRTCSVEVFDNKHNVFVLLYARGLSLFRRTIIRRVEARLPPASRTIIEPFSQ